MSVDVFMKTLRDQRRGLIGWGIGIAATVILMSAIWPSFSDVDFDAIMDQYPEALMEIFNVTDMSTAAGYLNAEIFSLMIPIIFIIYAIGRGARLIAFEEEEGTLEVLAAMPVPRNRVLIGKACGLAVAIGVLAVVLYASTWLSSLVFGLEVPATHILNATIAMYLLALEFGLIALAVSASTGRRALALGVASGLAGASYLLYIAGQLFDGLRPFLKASPFYQAISEGPLGPSLPPIVAVMPLVGLVVFALSVPIFDKRDLAV